MSGVVVGTDGGPGGVGGPIAGGGFGGGGDSAGGGGDFGGGGLGLGDALPFTGFSTLPLVIAGIVSVIAGAIGNRLGRNGGDLPAPPRLA